MSKDCLPNTQWPIGATVEFLDAWGKNPVRAKIIRYINIYEVLVEEDNRVRHCGQTWRIASAPYGYLAGLFSDLV